MATAGGKFGFLKKLKRLFKEYEGDIQLLTLPVILFLVLLIIVLLESIVRQNIQRDDLRAYTSLLPVHPYPMLTQVYEPAISAESALIMDNDSKGILYQKNPTFRFSMASTTKIMTALTILDTYSPDEVFTVKRTGVEGTVLGLQIGEQLTLESLLYAMLLPSSNDAAFAIADNYPGGEEAFIKKMNQKAQQFYLKDTHYGDPAGLNDDEDYTTVFDLAQLTSQALKQPLLVKIVATKEKTISNLSGKEYQLTNLNQLLGVNGVTGFKTGQTTGAGGVLVSTASKNNHTVIIVVMKSLDRFLDTQTLLQLVDNNVTYFQPIAFTK